MANRLFVANKALPEVSAINWKLTVINADICNAAALPSGDLIVFTGLLDFTENDDELAIILGNLKFLYIENSQLQNSNIDKQDSPRNESCNSSTCSRRNIA